LLEVSVLGRERRQEHAAVVMESLTRGALRIALAATMLWEVAAGIAGGLHVSAVLRPGQANVLPTALGEAWRSPLVQPSIPRDSETGILRDHHVFGVVGECIA
jgi:hypothetical protein